MKYLITAAFFFVTCMVSAQTTPELLTNKSVIDLYKAGLGDKLIVSKIELSDAKFDVSTNGLIALKKAGISESIIEAMVNKGASVSNTPSGATTTSSQKSFPGNSNAAPESINTIYLVDKTNKLIPLEKANATMRAHTKVLGYGGAETLYEIDGDQSATRIPSGGMPAFVINTGGGPGDAFVLYKVDIKKGKRQAIAATYSSIKGMKGAKGIIQVDVKMLKTNVYQLTPSAALNKGEYFFASKAGGNTLTSTNTDVYAFGVD